MGSKIESFNKEFCFNKHDLQESFSAFVKLNILDSEEVFTETHKASLLKLCDGFKKSLDDCNLPHLTDDWWYYDFEVRNDGIELNLLYCDFLDVNEFGEVIGTNSTVEFSLLHNKCDYISVDQFAKNHNVTNTTVRQWIRRGKLRTVKKVGRDWLIPSIAERPSRGFESVHYQWKVLPKDIGEHFSFLSGYQSIFIMQNEKQKTMFDCYLNDGYLNTHITLPNVEREKLEVALIGNSVIEVF